MKIFFQSKSIYFSFFCLPSNFVHQYQFSCFLDRVWLSVHSIHFEKKISHSPWISVNLLSMVFIYFRPQGFFLFFFFWIYNCNQIHVKSLSKGTIDSTEFDLSILYHIIVPNSNKNLVFACKRLPQRKSKLNKFMKIT